MNKLLSGAIIGLMALAPLLRAGAATCERKDFEGRWAGLVSVTAPTFVQAMSCEWNIRFNHDRNMLEIMPGSHCSIVPNRSRLTLARGFLMQHGTSCEAHGLAWVESSPREHFHFESLAAEGMPGAINTLMGDGVLLKGDETKSDAVFTMHMVRQAH